MFHPFTRYGLFIKLQKVIGIIVIVPVLSYVNGLTSTHNTSKDPFNEFHLILVVYKSPCTGMITLLCFGTGVSDHLYPYTPYMSCFYIYDGCLTCWFAQEIPEHYSGIRSSVPNHVYLTRLTSS